MSPNGAGSNRRASARFDENYTKETICILFFLFTKENIFDYLAGLQSNSSIQFLSLALCELTDNSGRLLVQLIEVIHGMIWWPMSRSFCSLSPKLTLNTHNSRPKRLSSPSVNGSRFFLLQRINKFLSDTMPLLTDSYMNLECLCRKNLRVHFPDEEDKRRYEVSDNGLLAIDCACMKVVQWSY